MAYYPEHAQDTLAKAQRLIKAATGEPYGDGEIVTNLGVGYAEPGYDSDAVWVLGNWNTRNRYGIEPTKADTVPKRLGDALERIGVECEWLDEWTECSNCYRIFRTEPNSYSWKPSYLWEPDSCEPICAKCAMEQGEESLASYVDEPTRCITWTDGEWLEQFGYERHMPDRWSYQSGWHKGMDDDPKAIYAEVKSEMPDANVVFVLDRNSQFNIDFSVYVRRTLYVIGYNTTGYLPEMEPYVIRGLEEAKSALCDEIERWVEGINADDVPEDQWSEWTDSVKFATDEVDASNGEVSVDLTDPTLGIHGLATVFWLEVAEDQTGRKDGE